MITELRQWWWRLRGEDGLEVHFIGVIDRVIIDDGLD